MTQPNYFVEEMTDGTFALCEGPSDYDYLDAVRDVTNEGEKVALVVQDRLSEEEAHRLLGAANRGELVK